MAESKYLYTDLVLTAENYNEANKVYSGIVKTNFFGTVEFKLKKFDTPKITSNGAKIVGDILLSNGDNKGIFENERNGQKSYSATLAPKPNPLYVNLKPLLTAGAIREYKVTFVELKDSEAAELQAKRDEVEVEF